MDVLRTFRLYLHFFFFFFPFRENESFNKWKISGMLRFCLLINFNKNNNNNDNNSNNNNNNTQNRKNIHWD